ncbi:MAG TPA: ricin-type beta-trefoil lectin domain protein [Streptosporangiaceae bacterium]
MMRGSRRLIVCAALTGLLTAGAVSASTTAAYAVGAGSCTASGAKATCTVTATIPSPAAIYGGTNATAGLDINVAWTADCTLGTQTSTTKGATDAVSPNVVSLTLPFTDPDSCAVTVTATLAATGYVNLLVSYAPAPSPSTSPTPTPTPAAVHLIKGYAGKCVDDAGNSSANRAKIQIWPCNSSDQAQGWAYTNSELVHNGKCLNDQRWGGNGSHVILYTCNGAANEIWSHRSNGEWVLSAKGGKLCLDDPAYSTKNGTPLIVWTCKNSSNQHWSVP